MYSLFEIYDHKERFHSIETNDPDYIKIEILFFKANENIYY